MPATRKTATAKKATTKATIDSAIVNNDAITAAEDMAADTAAIAREQFQTGFETMTETMTSMREQFEKAQAQLAEVNHEVMEVARTEISDAVQFTNDLAQAKTFTDAMTVQQQYWTNLLQSRVERTQALTEKSVEAAREMMTPAHPSMGAMFDPKAFSAFFPFAPKA